MGGLMKIRYLMVLIALTASQESVLADEQFSIQKHNGWVDNRDEMQTLNKELRERVEIDRQAIATLEQSGKIPAVTSSMEGAPPPVEVSAATTEPLSGISYGDKNLYPIPCNTEDGLYIVNFDANPPCNLSYPESGVKSTQIQYETTLSPTEMAERQKRTRLTWDPMGAVRGTD